MVNLFDPSEGAHYFELPSKYDDFPVQLSLELFCNPEGCVAAILDRWYNWLYSQLEDELPNNLFSCCEGTSGSISEQLLAIPITDAREEMIDFMVAWFGTFPDRNQALDYANRFRDDINTAISRYQNP